MFLCCCCFFLFHFLVNHKKRFFFGFRTPGCQWDNLSLGFLELLNWMYLVMLEGSPRREENKLQAVVLTWSTLLEWIRRQVSEFKLNITESIIHFASRDKEIMFSLFKSSNCLVNWPCTWMCRWWADGSALGCCLHLPSEKLMKPLARLCISCAKSPLPVSLA